MLNNCFLLNIDLKLKQLFDKIFLFTFTLQDFIKMK